MDIRSHVSYLPKKKFLEIYIFNIVLILFNCNNNDKLNHILCLSIIIIKSKIKKTNSINYVVTKRHETEDSERSDQCINVQVLQ